MKLELKELSYFYSPSSSPILRSLSFSIEPGSYWCVAGPNGSGKSTMLKLCCGLLPLNPGQDARSLSWNERPLASWSRLELARQIAFVPSMMRSPFGISVEDFVLQGRYSRSVSSWRSPTAADVEKRDLALKRVGAWELREKLITELSAGQTQLALLARALSVEPRVLVLDEATSNLDLHFQGRIFQLLADLNREGMTILLVCHDLNLAAEFCPNALWLKNGALAAKGPMTEVLSDQLLEEVYATERRLKVGVNPHTSKPKIFWRG